MHQQNQSILGPPGLIQNPQDDFVRLFQEFRTRFKSSKVTTEVTHLLEAFGRCYLPYMDINRVMKEDHTCDLFFKALLGNSRPTQAIPMIIQRCRYFAPIQPIVRTTVRAHDTGESTPPVTSTEAFITVNLPSIIHPNMTLSTLVENHFLLGQVEARHTHKTEMVQAIDGFAVFIFWTPEDDDDGTVQVENAPRRPKFALGGDVMLPTLEDGPTLYRCIAGVVHSGR